MTKKQILWLHSRALTLAKRSLENERQLLVVLLQLDAGSGCLALGYASLYAYCKQALKLSDWQSNAIRAIARKSETVPELKEAIRKNLVSFSNAWRIVSVITPENKDLWLGKARSLSQSDLKLELAKENPEPSVRERIRPISAEEFELVVGLDAEMERDLARLKEVLGKNAKGALKVMLKDSLKRHDPVAKAERVKVWPATVEEKSSPSSSRYIARPVFHKVQLRDKGACQHKGLDGHVCGEKFGVQVHHLDLWAYGGAHTEDNLITLCRRHHKYVHERRP